MLYYNKIDASEGIGVNKANASEWCNAGHYWYFLNYSFQFQPNFCNRCHDILMMSVNLSDFAIYLIIAVLLV